MIILPATPSQQIPTESGRSVSTDLGSAGLFDDTVASSTNFVIHTGGQSAPAAGYYLGGYNPSVTAGRNFGGDIAEVIFYQGMLTNADRLAVENYLKQKYYQINGGGLSFQWFFDGTAISDATNATLNFAAVQTTNAGTYAVTIEDGAGSVTSSNAVLIVGVAPSISLQPQSQSNGLGNSVTFTAAVGGGQPLTYQWQFNATNLPDATNVSLTLSDIQSADAGSYRLVASNSYGTVASSNALLTVLTSSLQVVNSSAVGSSSVVVPVQLLSAGNENSISFSLSFSNVVLTYSGATLGSNALGALLYADASQAASGRIGLEIELPGDDTFFSDLNNWSRLPSLSRGWPAPL